MTSQEKISTLKKGACSFTLVGKAKINDYSYAFDRKSKTSDWIYNSLNLGINCGNGNVVYASMMGGFNSENESYCYAYKKDDLGKIDYKNSIRISFSQRNDKQIVNTVADECFIKVGLEKDANRNTITKKFLFPYDAIKYISEHLTDGDTVRINGNLRYQYSPSTETIMINKNITSIYLSNAEPKQYQAAFIQKILVDKDSILKYDKEKNIIPISAYVIDYVSNVGNVPIKQQLAFCMPFEIEVNKENPNFTEKFINKFFKVKDRKSIDAIVVEGRIIESIDTQTATIRDLPSDIVTLIECGQITKEDALSKYTKGQKCKKFIIDKPYIKASSDKDDKENFSLSVVREENAYCQDDLLFIEDFLNENTENQTKFQENSQSQSNSDNWLKSLGL